MTENKELKKYCEDCTKVLNIYRKAIIETKYFNNVPEINTDSTFYESATGWGIEVFANRNSENKLYFSDDVLELNFTVNCYNKEIAKSFYDKITDILKEDSQDIKIELSYSDITFSLLYNKTEDNKLNHYQKILNIVEKTDDKRIIDKIIKLLIPKFREIYKKYIKLIFNAVTEFENELILQGLINGLTYEEIKEKYGITLYTNDERVLSLYRKYDVVNRAELCKKVK